MKKDMVRFTAQIPKWAADFLDQITSENFTSRNAEIVRSIKERMERFEKEKTGATA